MHSARSLRRAYVDWVEEQVEAYKDAVPRGQLLDLADEVIRELDTDKNGQYQWTELLLCSAMNRHILRLLKLPSFRAWRTRYLEDMAAPREPAGRDLIAAAALSAPAVEMALHAPKTETAALRHVA